MIQLDQLSELAKLSTQKSRHLLSDVKDYRNKIYAVFYLHTFFISNSIFLVRSLFSQAREPSQISNCFRGCLEIKWLLKSSKEKSYLFLNGTKPSVFTVLMKSLDNRSLFFFFCFWTTIFRQYKQKSLHCIVIQVSFGRGKNIQNVTYKFKASQLLSRLLNFLPKLRPI